LPDVCEKICHQSLYVPENIRLFCVATVAMIALASFIVVTDQTASLSVSIIQSIFQAKGMIRGFWNPPEHHLAQGAIGVEETGTMEKDGDHMV